MAAELVAQASAARRCAFAVVRRVFERGAYADRSLHTEARGLDGRDRSLAMRLAYGTIQRRATLDHLVVALAGRPLDELDPAVLAALRIGLYQLHFADGIADHAAVNESVTLARTAGAPRSAGLVNAVLRRSTREGAQLLGELDYCTAAGAAVLHSLPVWLAERWFSELGHVEARALMHRMNEPAESALRVNTLVAEADGLAERLPVAVHLDPGMPDALVLDGPFDAHGSVAWREGAFMPQSRASMLVSHAVDPSPGERVLDLCAAPGAKTTHLAAMMEGRGSIVAVERHRGRAEALERTCRRMRRTTSPWRCPTRVCHVLLERPSTACSSIHPARGWEPFSRGPTCAGVCRRRASGSSRRRSPRLLTSLQPRSRRGRLVYSTCTLSVTENEDQVRDFLRRHQSFSPAPARSDLSAWEHPSVPGLLLALPHRHRTDGFFIAPLDRARNAGPAEV